MKLYAFFIYTIFCSTLSFVHASSLPVTIPLYDKGASTYYVKGQIGDLAESDFMIDTGSGYMTINEHTLQQLVAADQADYIKEIRGVLANGAELTVSVWRIKRISIHHKCLIHDVEAAVFPGKTRQILGLTALKKAAPFTISVDPPQITLSRCMSSL